MGLASFIVGAALASGCPAAPVQHGVNVQSPIDVAPWVASGRGVTRLVGRLDAGYLGTLGDRRVRDAEGLVLYAGRQYKIAWLPRQSSGTGAFLSIAGTRLGEPGSFSSRNRQAISRFYPSTLTVPAAGCWRVRLGTGRLRWTIHLLVIEPPSGPRCESSPVGMGPNPVDPGVIGGWVAASPASSRINGTLTIPGVEGAAIYAGGHWPDGTNTKVLWRTAGIADGLRIAGIRLDGAETLRLTLPSRTVPAGIYPSMVNVPVPGCWLLTLRGGGRGGVIVVSALSAR